ncbi:GNAT family N-acetyltransferase [Mesorhizobium sp. M1428]|uniref:GNAT family N-acetyltransferase n=1 Tax=Mesorhizobium sp. M1428 TaxID=2957102 RepID=UPI00333A2127
MTRYETSRLILTRLFSEHEDLLFNLHNDPLVQELLYDSKPKSIEDVREMVDTSLAHWNEHGFGFWMVYKKTDGCPLFIGRCGLRVVQGTDNIELVYVFSREGVGQGMGPEAARFGITHALANSTKKKIVAFIAHHNERSKRAAKKIGLRYVDDRYRNNELLQYYEMSREEYFSRPHPKYTA